MLQCLYVKENRYYIHNILASWLNIENINANTPCVIYTYIYIYNFFFYVKYLRTFAIPRSPEGLNQQ